MTPSPFHGIFSGFQESHTDAPEIPLIQSSEPASAPVVRSESSSGQQVGQIAVDIYEMDNYYIIRAPIAGVKLQDLDIEVDGKILTIRGTRQQPDSIAESQYYLQECFWGEFSRSITLPTAIDAKKVKATFSKDSILKVIVPKEERVKIIRVNEA